MDTTGPTGATRSQFTRRFTIYLGSLPEDTTVCNARYMSWVSLGLRAFAIDRGYASNTTLALIVEGQEEFDVFLEGYNG
jgi:hypothetical protein